MQQHAERLNSPYALVLRVILTLAVAIAGEIELLRDTYHFPREAPEVIALVIFAPLAILLAASAILGIWRRGVPSAARIVVVLAFFAMPIIAFIYELELECGFALAYCS